MTTNGCPSQASWDALAAELTDAAEANALKAHLAGCDACQTALRGAQDGEARLATWLSTPPPAADPAALARVEARVAERLTAAPPRAARPATPTTSGGGWLRMAASLTAVAAIVGGGYVLAQLGQGGSKSLRASAPEKVVYDATFEGASHSRFKADHTTEDLDDAGSSAPLRGYASPPRGPRPPAEQLRRAGEPQEDMQRLQQQGGQAPGGRDGSGGGEGDEGRPDDSPADRETRGDGFLGGKEAESKEHKPKPTRTWKRSSLTPHTSKLMVGDTESLPIKAMQAEVRVDGFRARVVLDLYFFNDRGRQLEGQFKLRLPTGATPYFLAFGKSVYRNAEQPADRPALLAAPTSADLAPETLMARRKETWEAPREARMVPREKAAHAYTETVRRRVDPALMEWSGAGVFSARIFPIVSNRLHRVTVGYDLDLTPVGDQLELRVDLPEGIARRVLDLGVATIPGQTLALTPQVATRKAPGRQWFRFENPQARSIALRVGGVAAPLIAGDGFVATRFVPTVEDAGKGGSGAKRAVLLLDTSLSANPERFTIWLELARAILDRNRPELAEFAVCLFNVETYWWKKAWTANTPEHVAALMKTARGLALEGATRLDEALTEAARPSWMLSKETPPPHDVFLLSDGAITWGERDPQQLARRLADGFAGPLFAYTTGMAGVDRAVLQQLARSSGGSVFHAAGEAEVAKAATAHRARPWRLGRVTIDGVTDLMLAGRPRSWYPGQPLVVVGRGTPGDEAVATVHLRRGDERRAVTVDLTPPVGSPLAARTYGQVATAELELVLDEARPAAIAYARHFRVTGKSCSLLMLESEADYARFGIKPEDDLALVRKTPATVEVAAARDRSGDKLGSPRAAFCAWLDRLATMPGVTLQGAAELRKVFEALPEQSFTVPARRLVCAQRTWRGLPGGLTEMLAAKQLTYDAAVAEARRRKTAHGTDDALKALTSLVEQRPGDLVLARDVALEALAWGRGGQAYHALARVAQVRPWEPPTYLLLARCAEQVGRADLALAYYEIALRGQFNARFGELTRIAGLETLRLLRRIQSGQAESDLSDYAARRLPQLTRRFGVGNADLLVTMMWNTDGTDIDLHVVEPSGEVCFYRHNRTRQGARLTKDVTQGYGPEMYILRKAQQDGRYRIRAKFYRADANRMSTRTKVYLTIYRGWGTPEEQVIRKVVTLATGKQMHDVAEVVLGK